MTLTFARRTAAPLFALAALLLADPTTSGQDAPDAKSVLEKVKDGAGLKAVREKLAADPVGARFRVDGFALTENNSLQVVGVMLVPGADDTDRDEAEKATRDKVIAAVQQVAGAKDFKDFDFADAVRAVRGERLPHLQLQKAANEAGKTDPAADQLRFSDARFDAAGRLVISGLIGSDPRTQEWLTASVSKALAGNLAAVDKDGKPTAPVFQLVPPPKGTDWPLSPAVLQKALAATRLPALTRIRVERAYLVASPARADETNPAGVNWKYVITGLVLGTSRPDPKAIEGVVNRVVADAKWPPLKDGDLEGLTSADNRVPDPAPLFQKAVAARPALDGVRLDPRTEFGPDGKLVLNGLHPGLDARGRDELLTAVRGTLDLLAAGSDSNPLYLRLAAAGISTDKLEPVKVRDLHAELRKWAAENLDDVRLTRLYFDDNGVLTLVCEAPDPTVKAAVEKELIARAARLLPAPPPAELAPPAELPKDDKKQPEDKKPEDKKPEDKQPEEKQPEDKQDSARAFTFTSSAAAYTQDEPKSPAGSPVPTPTVKLSPFKAGLTKYLQQVVSDPRNSRWQALLIERGYFDENGRYTVRGVADSEEQKKQFADFLAELAKDPEWAAYFRPTPAAPPDLEVIPMSRLEERLRRVMPAYEVFDGIRVSRGRYVFPDDKRYAGPILVFDAQVVGRPDPDAPARLRALIAEDAKYFGRRLPKGRPVEIRPEPPAVPSSDQLGELSLGYAARALVSGDLLRAKEWLDAGLLHYPHDSAVWFLSAYYNLLTGDLELARRDLFRLIELEGRLDFDGPAQRKRRYAAAKDLQGPKRDELEKLWLACWREVKDGAGPIKLAPTGERPGERRGERRGVSPP
jgi:hypothetical protein